MNTIATRRIREPKRAKGFYAAIVMKGKTHAVHFSFLQREKPVVYVDAGDRALSHCNCFKHALGAIRAAERAADLHADAKPIVLENDYPGACSVTARPLSKRN